MLKIMKAAGLTAAVLAGSIAAPLSIAHAQDYELRIGPKGVGVHDRNQDQDRYAMRRSACDPADAMDAARDNGMRRPHVVRVTDRSVTVEGMTSDGPDRMRFANVRGCPEI